MFLRLARWFLRLFGRLDLVFLELSGDDAHAWLAVVGEKGPFLPDQLARLRPFHPACVFLRGLTEHEGQGKYRLRGDQVWTFLDQFAGRREIRFEAKSAVAWRKVPAEPLDVEVACDPAGPSMTVRYLGDAKWARGGWLRRGDAWWNLKLSDEHAELVLKGSATFGPERLRKALVEFAPSWKPRGTLWTVDPKRTLIRTRVDADADGALTVRCEHIVPREKLRPLPGDDGWALLDDTIVPLPRPTATLERALRNGPVRLDPDAAADFLAGEGAGLLPGARVAPKATPILTAKMEGEALFLEIAFVWGEDASATENEMRGRRTIRRGMTWCRIDEKALDEARTALTAALTRAYLDPRPDGARLRLSDDDVPEFLAFGAEWLKDWRIARGPAPDVVRALTKALVNFVRSEADGLGAVGVDVEFDLGGVRAPLAEMVPLMAEGTRWLHRGDRWIEFDRACVGRVLRRGTRVDAHALPAELAAWKALGEVTLDEEVKRRRLLVDAGRVPTEWPKSFSVSSTGAMRLFSWFAACSDVGISPTVLAPVDRDLFAAVAAFLATRKERGGRGPILVVTGAKRLASWAEGLSMIVPMRTATLKRKPPSQEELAGIDALLVAPNTLDTAVFRAVDTEWPVVVFDQVDRTFPTDSSKLFRAASILRTRRRIGCLSTKEALAKTPKMHALFGLVYPGAEGDPLQFIAPFSHDPGTGGHLILPSAQYLRPTPKPDPIRQQADEILRDPDPKRAIAKMQALWRAQRATRPRLDEWMIDWIADLYYLHVGPDAGLAWQWKHVELLARFTEIDLLFERQDGKLPLEAWQRLAAYRPSGKFYDQHREEVDRAYRQAIEAVAPRPPDRTYRVRRALFGERELVIGRARRWSSLAAPVAAVLQHAENRLRESLGVPGRVRGYALDPQIAARLETPALTLDTSLVERLQKESAEVAEILAAPEDAPVAEEEKVEPVRTADGRMLYTSLAETRAVWRDLDFVQRQIVTDVYRGAVRRLRELEIQLRPLGQMPLAALESINERASDRMGDVLIVVESDALSIQEEFRDELEVVIDGRIAVAEESDPYRTFLARLTEPERALVAALARDGTLPNSKIDELLRPHGIMASMALDAINEKACETVGDIVLLAEGAGVAIEEDDLPPIRKALTPP